jgi:hypothetical protein
VSVDGGGGSITELRDAKEAALALCRELEHDLEAAAE